MITEIKMDSMEVKEKVNRNIKDITPIIPLVLRKKLVYWFDGDWRQCMIKMNEHLIRYDILLRSIIDGKIEGKTGIEESHVS